MLDLLFCG